MKPRHRTDPRPDRAPAHATPLRALRLRRRLTIKAAAAWLTAQGLPTSIGGWRKWESGERPMPPIVGRLLRKM